MAPDNMAPDERSARVDWLTALGVPEAFREAIIDAPKDRMTSWGWTVVSLIMVACAIGMMVGAFIWLEELVDARAAALAVQSGATLTYVNVGMGPVLLLFALIALMGWILVWLAGRYCNHTDDDELLIYDIGFSSGERFDLGASQPFKGSKIEAIVEIDARIDGNIEHRRWSHLDRDPAAPTCLNYWAGQFDRDGRRRLAKLLRLSADEARGPVLC